MPGIQIVSRLCNSARQDFSALCVNGINYLAWNECAKGLLERFFPVSGLKVEGSMCKCGNWGRQPVWICDA